MTIWNPVTIAIVCQLLSLLLPGRMSFSVEGFTENPRLATLWTLKKTELASLLTHYINLEVVSATKKANI